MLRPKLILMISLALFLLGCTREDPNPETRDPIYKFLQTEYSTLKGAFDVERKKIEEAEKALAKTEPLTHERKLALRDLESAKRRLAKIEQDAAYIEIRAARRKVEARRDYKLAFLAGKQDQWPDPKEYEHFMTQHRLRTASRQWDARVPKLHDRILAAWPKPDPKAKQKEPVAGE